ncbi:MAG: HindIII family type II restriction endonuclease, partial [Candidatus Symbiothrix sp.]|nr:HindIII family type II restriction endonuclease [Candidatus Symbiothrix sp.]
MSKGISQEAIISRNFWIKEIQTLSGNFSNDSDHLEAELEREIKEAGVQSLIAHLHLCGNIPE